MLTIHNWSVGFWEPNAYRAPEISEPCLLGNVVGHPRKGDQRVRTSPITTVDGRIVTTESGSVYRLGRIDPVYREWLRENRPEWDWREPITFIRSAA